MRAEEVDVLAGQPPGSGSGEYTYLRGRLVNSVSYPGNRCLYFEILDCSDAGAGQYAEAHAPRGHAAFEPGEGATLAIRTEGVHIFDKS